MKKCDGLLFTGVLPMYENIAVIAFFVGTVALDRPHSLEYI